MAWSLLNRLLQSILSLFQLVLLHTIMKRIDQKGLILLLFIFTSNDIYYSIRVKISEREGKRPNSLFLDKYSRIISKIEIARYHFHLSWL